MPVQIKVTQESVVCAVALQTTSLYAQQLQARPKLLDPVEMEGSKELDALDACRFGILKL